ncbi:integrase, partial [Bacillus wiedmannii]
MDNKSKNENLPILKSQGEFTDIYLHNIKVISSFMYNNRYMNDLEQKIEDA